MANISRTADTLVSQLDSDVRRGILDALQPALRQLVEAVKQIEASLEADSKPAPGKPGRKPGRPAGVATAERMKPGPKPGRKKAAAKKAGKGGKRPRGQLKQVVQRTLTDSSKAMKLSEIRDAILASPEYAGSNPKTLYTQIAHQLKSISVKKTADGRYGSK